MASLLTIGEFSRMTHLSIKALRHYDELGLLTPAAVDSSSGYRHYAVAQVPTAQVIRRFRELDMPLDRIKDVLASADPRDRDRVLLDHLASMEAKLDQTQAAVAALRGMIEGRAAATVEHRVLASLPALAITEVVEWDATEGWIDEAMQEIDRVLADQHLTAAGPAAALYSTAFFEAHEGEVTAFIPVTGAPRSIGRTHASVIAGGPHAVAVHEGPFATLDTAYAALGAHVAERGVGRDGPIREHYVSSDPDAPLTEVCWPVHPPPAGG